MSQIKVTSEDLISTSHSLSSGANQVADELAMLRSKVESLIGGQWSGAASQSFHELWQKWHTGAAQVQTALDGISQMLNGAARVYQDTEDQLATNLRG